MSAVAFSLALTLAQFAGRPPSTGAAAATAPTPERLPANPAAPEGSATAAPVDEPAAMPAEPPAAPPEGGPEAMARDGYLTLKSSQLFLLFGWGSASAIGGGLGAVLVRAPFAWGLELQAIAWGLIDCGLATSGLLANRGLQQAERGAVPSPPSRWAALARSDRDLFWLNAKLDLLYLGVGGALWGLTRRPFARGSGAGIVIQGLVLLIFDSLCALALG